MTDVVRRGLLGGVVLAGAALGLAGRAGAQALAANQPQLQPDLQDLREKLDKLDPAKVIQPVGQDWANLLRYHAANLEAMKLSAFNRRAVFMGDSITDFWPAQVGDLFPRNGLIGRGISGQTTAQMVLRFTPDVIALKPLVVHILGGTNDIAENLDPYDFGSTTNNLMAMATMAGANNIRVVLGSVPPASGFGWRPALGNRSDKIQTLNAWIKAYCEANACVYADYWSALDDGKGGMRPELGNDSVHPNAAGYAVMSPIALAAVDKATTRGGGR